MGWVGGLRPPVAHVVHNHTHSGDRYAKGARVVHNLSRKLHNAPIVSMDTVHCEVLCNAR